MGSGLLQFFWREQWQAWLLAFPVACHRDRAQVDPESGPVATGRGPFPAPTAADTGRRLVRFVAVNGLFNLKRTIETAGGPEGRFVGDVLQPQFEIAAAPTHDQKLFAFAAVAVAQLAEGFVFF